MVWNKNTVSFWQGMWLKKVRGPQKSVFKKPLFLKKAYVDLFHYCVKMTHFHSLVKMKVHLSIPSHTLLHTWCWPLRTVRYWLFSVWKNMNFDFKTSSCGFTISTSWGPLAVFADACILQPSSGRNPWVPEAFSRGTLGTALLTGKASGQQAD